MRCVNNKCPTGNTICYSKRQPAIVCYRTPGFTLTQDQWNQIVNNVDPNKHSMLIGDFNSHNQSWNCIETDKNGEYLSNSIDNSKLFLLNNNSITRIGSNQNSKSNIDLAFVSCYLADKIDLSVGDKTLGSDHYPFYINVYTYKSNYKKETFKFKSVNTDWSKFAELRDNSYHRLLATEFDNLPAEDEYCFFST